MIAAELLRILAALIAVIGLIGLAALAARRFGLASASGGFMRRRRLEVIETLALDARRRLAIIKCDDREHLIVLGATNETLIASDLEGAPEIEAAPTARDNPFASFEQFVARLKPASAAAPSEPVAKDAA